MVFSLVLTTFWSKTCFDRLEINPDFETYFFILTTKNEWDLKTIDNTFRNIVFGMAGISSNLNSIKIQSFSSVCGP